MGKTSKPRIRIPSGLVLFLGATLVPSLVFNSSFSTRAHEQTRPPAVITNLERELRQLPEPVGGGLCQVDLEFVDAETGTPVSALVRAMTSDGKVVHVGHLLRRGWMVPKWHPGNIDEQGRTMRNEWYCLVKPTKVILPQTLLVIEAFCGLESVITRCEINLSGKTKTQLTVPIRRFADLPNNGWYGGNTHLHLQDLTREEADLYLQWISRVDDIDLVFVSHLRRQNPPGAEDLYISNEYTPADLTALSGHGVQFGHGEEHRNNGRQGAGYGHVMFLDIKRLIRPVSIGQSIMGEGADYPPLRHGIQAARHDGATVVWCHDDDGIEDVPNWLAGHVHAQNIFDSGSDDYEKTFYRYLNIGLKVPFSTGTDWFIYDFGRVYTRPKRSVTLSSWLEALEAGRSFITNGPLLEFNAGKSEIGDTMVFDKPTTQTITGRALGRVDFRRIELIHNGQVVAVRPAEAGQGMFTAKMSVDLHIKESGWVALRIPQLGHEMRSELGVALFAHTSPIYFQVSEQSIMKQAAAESLLADMVLAIESIDRQFTFSNVDQRREILTIYYDGIDDLRQRMAPVQEAGSD